MIQEILTYITVSAAVGYTLYSLWKVWFTAPDKSSCSGGCSSCCDAKSLLVKAINHQSATKK